MVVPFSHADYIPLDITPWNVACVFLKRKAQIHLITFQALYITKLYEKLYIVACLTLFPWLLLLLLLFVCCCFLFACLYFQNNFKEHL